MGISRTWPRAGAHVGSITEPTKVYKCMTDEERKRLGAEAAAPLKAMAEWQKKQAVFFLPHLKDVLRRIQNLQVACTGVLEMTVRTDFSPDFYDGVRLMVICQLRKNSGTLRHFAFYSWDKTATMEATLAELNQHVQFLIELDKRPAYETKT